MSTLTAPAHAAAISLGKEASARTTTTADNEEVSSPEPSCPMLIKEPTHLTACLERLRKHNTGVIFYNCDETFKLLLRNDPTVLEGLIGAEICIVYGLDENGDPATPQDEVVQRVVQLDPDGYEDEEDTFVLGNFAFDADDVEGATDAAARINDIFAMTICRCQRYFIKDRSCQGNDLCPFCTMTSTKDDIARQFCCVCQEISAKMHMIKQPCCSQHIHTACLNKWHGTVGEIQCPMCRIVL